MSVLFDIGAETGDLTEFSATTTDGGDLSVTEAAALAGSSYGLAYLVDDTTSLDAQIEFTHTTDYFRLRLYLDPNSLTMANTDDLLFLAVLNTNPTSKIKANLKYTTAAGYAVYIAFNDDAEADTTTSDYVITDAAHSIEINAQKASSAVASDATCAVYIDGALKETISSIDLFDEWFDKGDGACNARFRAHQLDVGTSGTFYMDEFAANDDGSLIGEHVETVATGLNVDGQGFNVNFVSTETDDAETVYAAQGAGTNIVLESVTISSQNPGTATLGSGATGGAVDTPIIGPIALTTSGRPYQCTFPRPVVVDANTALTFDTGSSVGVQCSVQGYVLE